MPNGRVDDAHHLPEELLPFKLRIELAHGSGSGLLMSMHISDESRLHACESVFGWGGAAGTFMRIDPHEEMVIVTMPQRLVGME